jgi:DNA gyrase subunit A
MIATAGGQACRFNERELRPMGRATHGVIGIRLKNKKDAVVAMTVVDITGSLFTITENGFGKRSPIDEYRMTHRGSKGVRTIVTNERNGNVVFVSQVNDEKELIITTEHGMTVRIPVRDIREQGRNTMGVRIMRLNEGDKVVSVTITKILEENGEGASQVEAMERMQIGMLEEKTEPAEAPKPSVEQKEPAQEVKEQVPVMEPKQPAKKEAVRKKPMKITKPKKEKPTSVKKIKIKPAKKTKTVKPKKAKLKTVKKPKKTKPAKKLKTKKPQKKKLRRT